MTGEVDLAALLEGVPRRRKLPPDVAKARQREQFRRHSAAGRLVLQALSRLHPEEYRSLLDQAQARLVAERGPLPGDEPVTS